MPTLAQPPARTAPRAEPRDAPRTDPRPTRDPRPPVRPVWDEPAEAIGYGLVTLRGVSWELYETIRALPENAHHKLTYDAVDGVLEIEMPTGSVHDRVAGLLGDFIKATLQTGGTPYRSTGGFTLRRRPGRGGGAEPDRSFYVQSHDVIRDQDAIDLAAGDPPPDLLVEVVQESPMTDRKWRVLARLGVPEVWVWEDGALTFHVLTDRTDDADDPGAYEVVADSVAVPGFPAALAAGLLNDRVGRGDGELVAAFREGAA